MKALRIILALAVPAVLYWAIATEPWKDKRKFKPLEKLPPAPVEPVKSELPKQLTP